MSRVTLILLGLFFATTLAAARFSVRATILRGNEAFRKGDQLTAESLYSEATRRRPDSGAALFNLGEAAYDQRHYQEAVEDFRRSALLLQTPMEQSRAHYNRGNALFRLDELQGALGALEDALRLNPSDEDARYNFDLVTALLRDRQGKDGDKSAAPPMTSREAAQLLGSLGPAALKTRVNAERLSDFSSGARSGAGAPDK